MSGRGQIHRDRDNLKKKNKIKTYYKDITKIVKRHTIADLNLTTLHSEALIVYSLL
jgi:hypothetical protein